MPQLNPAPWLAILIFAWLTFLLILPPKIMAHTFPKEPTPQDTKTNKHSSWAWSWP
uniref:ATP synthase complex subunit 8 n=1 Tax=Acanthocepola krusensternii TaxID=270597 RepID=A0A1V1FHB1_9TELE|nr:ATP synthase F0 subunit 8 [Acanthocepola krusensternii]BAX03660.1 ATPase subunit 8 [Acanthocepola krusensternii]BBU26025.1 ATPase subunit 8 [Acanthocepola krusensternii]